MSLLLFKKLQLLSSFTIDFHILNFLFKLMVCVIPMRQMKALVVLLMEASTIILGPGAIIVE